MMHSRNIITKLKLLTTLPVLIISIGFFIFIVNSYQSVEELKYLKTDILNIKNISHLINELQRERGISSGYLGSKGRKFKYKLFQQRKEVDNALKIFIQDYKKEKHYYLKSKRDIIELREKIDLLNILNEDSFDLFSKKIMEMLGNYLKMTIAVKDSSIKNKLQVYSNLSIMKESLGQIRGAFNGIFSSKSIDKELVYRVIHAKGMYDISLYRFESTASADFLTKLHKIIYSSNYKNIEDIIQYSLKNITDRSMPNPEIWWKKMTEEINKFYGIEENFFQSMDQYIENKTRNIINKLIINISLFLFFIFFVLYLGLKIKESVLRNVSLLNDYKNAVDRSSIVSKTNKKGIITYANDKFCHISGYTIDELIGKPHNIIRHPDMPKHAFKDLWNKILQKEAWSGIVKNRKKDGSSYIVEATINPILNHKGEIEEFIAIRNDITESIHLHEELENTQKDLIFKMGEIGETRSLETGNHVRRVAKYSEILAKYYGLDTVEIKYLVLASPMHDIGKVAIPDDILNKQEKFTESEWKTMQTHAQIGYELFKDSNKPLLKAAAIITYEHHEKYDGSGYPRGLIGENIHIFGRITALADVFDALGSDRCYKKAWSDDKIFNLIKKEKGKHFDPQLVDIFFEHLEEFLEIRDQYKESI